MCCRALGNVGGEPNLACFWFSASRARTQLRSASRLRPLRRRFAEHVTLGTRRAQTPYCRLRVIKTSIEDDHVTEPRAEGKNVQTRAGRDETDLGRHAVDSRQCERIFTLFHAVEQYYFFGLKLRSVTFQSD